MKKNLLLILIVVLVALSLRAQDFKVIHVNGNIVVESTQKSLVRGNAFKASEQFLYKSNNAKAVVVNTKIGKRYILKGDAGSTYRKVNLIPSMNNISSRGGALNNRLDLKNHFQGEYVILDALKAKINSQVFPMDDSHFFYIRYLYKGEQISKKLNYNKDTLIIDKESLLKVDGKPILNEDITDMELFYYSKDGENVTSSLISSSFYPVFPDNNNLKEEVEILISTLKNKDKDYVIEQIAGYISEVYGKPNKENIKSWYERNF